MRGDHLVVDRGLYRHHGVDLGNGTVIHFAGPGNDKRITSIRVDAFEDFARGAAAWVRVYGRRLDPEETVRRAQSLVGATGYHLISKNCEHLASWCVTGAPESRQVERVCAATGTAAVAALASVGSADVLATIGSVGGVSGPGVMSALATVGHLAGGGAARGLYLLGLAPGLLGMVAVWYATRDRTCLTDEERRARVAARYGAGVGGIGTGFAAVALVSSTGAVSGLGGAGITSGLAAIGSSAGGGMVAGTSVLVAAPALVAGVLGWLVYRLALRWMRAPVSPPLAIET
jgi:hypothetical protein